ncbi:hypothetical protein V1503_05470 [Bacillus sp. SCS-151]|uniref:hypothetical protein n=1 Tax=Nanhaiella sioensis TaxID=3115293 RepID=UPI00397C4D65
MLPISIQQPASGVVSIVRFRNQSIQTKSAAIKIISFQDDGLIFVCDLKFPVSKEIILKINLDIFKEEINVFGSIDERCEIGIKGYEHVNVYHLVSDEVIGDLSEVTKKYLKLSLYKKNLEIIQQQDKMY